MSGDARWGRLPETRATLHSRRRRLSPRVSAHVEPTGRAAVTAACPATAVAAAAAEATADAVADEPGAALPLVADHVTSCMGWQHSRLAAWVELVLVLLRHSCMDLAHVAEQLVAQVQPVVQPVVQPMTCSL